jgi:hypothetical protein
LGKPDSENGGCADAVKFCGAAGYPGRWKKKMKPTVSIEFSINDININIYEDRDYDPYEINQKKSYDFQYWEEETKKYHWDPNIKYLT